MMKKDKKSFDRPEAGMALLALLAIMLILGMIAYSFVGIVSTHRTGIAAQDRSVKSLYLAESGLQIGNQWLYDNPTLVSAWPEYTSVEIYTDEPLGAGTFSMTVIHAGSTFYAFTASGNVSP